MKQGTLFGDLVPQEGEQKYTGKIEAPNYEPKNRKPHLLELVDRSKTMRLIQQIENSDLPEDEKKVLVEAAHRHSVFNYEKIADYYAHSSKEMQRFMERSALVIIDFEDAIQLGYVELCEEIRKQYLEYEDDPE